MMDTVCTNEGNEVTACQVNPPSVRTCWSTNMLYIASLQPIPTIEPKLLYFLLKIIKFDPSIILLQNFTCFFSFEINSDFDGNFADQLFESAHCFHIHTFDFDSLPVSSKRSHYHRSFRSLRAAYLQLFRPSISIRSIFWHYFEMSSFDFQFACESLDTKLWCGFGALAHFLKIQMNQYD
ncbi:unnamed protein product [Albugo candida]|uniref:Uncharacterized protein n=1 Tax=Albugo candida TaxID=65357 RepID=A0A024GHS4_9STRA|nr:unnamed protein product [Albugo candida]|eukprot:CCI46403.1 unnamed protein product [Albugo candida]